MNFVAGKIFKNYVKRILISLFTAISLPVVILLMFKADGINYDPRHLFFVLTFFAGFFLGLISSIISDRKGPIDNWNTWSSLAFNQKLSIFILIFTLSPLIVRAAKLTELERYLTPIFYGYWLCGLSLLVFVILFKLLSPQIYAYKTLQDFKLEVNSLIGLRDQAREALNSINARERNNKLYESEKPFLSQDKIFLQKIIENKKVDIGDAYAVLKKRLAYHNSLGRFFVVVFLTAPCCVLPLIFTSNVLLVFDQGYNLFSDGSSILKSLVVR
ncbi:hypothetical protein [uncultured Microbulbifer sp.]|uniref:hypothetical protein n=1 Tax=uncultured Microbulbifer sp. TaxID=348147 RepID=UPI00261E67D7|nr:hypothetical protein [uncultured Microbulbifer sp.]